MFCDCLGVYAKLVEKQIQRQQNVLDQSKEATQKMDTLNKNEKITINDNTNENESSDKAKQEQGQGQGQGRGRRRGGRGDRGGGRGGGRGGSANKNQSDSKKQTPIDSIDSLFED